MNKIYPQCAKCPAMYCVRMPMAEIQKDILEDYCPMKTMSELIKKSIKKYDLDDLRSTYIPATITEKEGYEQVRGVLRPVRPRIRELVEFAKKIGVRNIGVAFCVGLHDEAAKVSEILEEHEFVVASVLCKCGGVDKTKLGVSEEYKLRGPLTFDAGCNPIVQAELLNKSKTEINVIVGLCIGHDIIFTMNSKAPVTTLIVKDRLTGHNPVISLYTQYHRGIIRSKEYGK